jgi:ATP-dependent DNA helicase RecG
MVALLAAYAIVTAKEQVAVMAPTELLARQHYQYFKTYLKDVNIALLTRKTKDKDMMKHMIFSHQYDIVIGTHALIEEDVLFKQLGLVVIDEQHKFGVSTREKLIEKGKHKDVLYLTATPIPRTLAMLTYGYAKISLMKEKPKRREAILTKYITKQTIDDMYSMMHSALIRKEHIFLVVPAITSDKVTDNIETVYQEIIQEFPHAPIFMLHGKLSSDDQDRMMENFITTPGSILLSTTMIEVGIDIPTATLIGIYAAENFGLAQLHQLRGRVGRGNLASFCYLISTKEDVERLDMLVQSDDGFKLAEFDLIERGPGDFIGHLQSGYLDFKYLDILEDEEIFLTAKEDLEKIMNQPDFNSNPKYRYLYKTYTKQT